MWLDTTVCAERGYNSAPSMAFILPSVHFYEYLVAFISIKAQLSRNPTHNQRIPGFGDS